jgi:hypothetical protein
LNNLKRSSQSAPEPENPFAPHIVLRVDDNQRSAFLSNCMVDGPPIQCELVRDWKEILASGQVPSPGRAGSYKVAKVL